MTLPGFNAESSVYKPKGRYYTASIPNGASGIGSGVRLALGPCRPERPGCFQNCMSQCEDDPYYCDVNCHCECRGGPPCCYYQ